MLVASPASSSSTSSPPNASASTNLEDILDLAQFDFGTSPSADSRSSSHSPSASTNPLPPTPPQTTPPSTFGTLDNDLFYGSFLTGLSGKPGHSFVPSTDLSTFNYADLFASYASGSTIPAMQESIKPTSTQLPDIFSGLFQSTAVATSANPSINTQQQQPLAIDPQLVASPTAPSPATSFPHQSATEDDAEDEDEDDDDDGHDDAAAVILKVAKSKPARKSPVVSGGIVKKTTAAVRDSKEPDDWRPSPEEYKKLSSKEKRQLRNKISARNFRVRRKEYISTLESHIADRDNLIEAIRSELGASRIENYELRKEVDALKRALLEGRTTVDSLALPPPAPLEVDENMNVTVRKPATPTSTANSNTLTTPNTRKDLPNSPISATARPFWGGAASFGGGVTPVHTTLIPELPFPASPFASLASTLTSKTTHSPILTALDNINPAMNSTSAPPPVEKSAPLFPKSGTFDLFTDPLTFKSIDPYRMQLWQNVARQGALIRAQQPQNTAPTAQPITQTSPLTAHLLPAFFQEPTLKPAQSSRASSSLFGLLSGKSQNGLNTPPVTPPPVTMALPTSAEKQINGTNAQAAYMAALASQTLLSRMTNAFWDAFSGAPTPAPANRSSSSDSRNWDVEKVRRVLEGKAVVRVVDVDERTKSADDLTSVLEEKMKALSVQGERKEAERPSIFKGLLGQ